MLKVISSNRTSKGVVVELNVSNGFDINIGMQSVIYSYFMSKVKDDTRISHVTRSDIDEFWFPMDFKTHVDDYIKSKSSFDIMSIHWLCQRGDETKFLPAFNNLKVNLDRHVKSFTNVKNKKTITKLKPHCPEFNLKEDIKHVDSNCNNFIPHHGQKSDFLPKFEFDSYYLHRLQRSEMEYISLLNRKRPSSDLPIKSNRNGFKIEDSLDKLDLSKPELAKYHKSLNNFIAETAIYELINEERSKMVAEYR
jgi:hypothetical protein